MRKREQQSLSKEKVEIRSVIGSAAGGIMGLAAGCELEEDEIIEIGLKDLSEITQTDRREYKDS